MRCNCIRCGACLNVCPIFKNIGGHAYGTTYQGPIGSVITPHFRGLQDWKHLSGASSLCGACTEACPVKIDIHHHLLHNRRNAMTEKPAFLEKLMWKGFRLVHESSRGSTPSPRKFTPWLLELHPLVKASPLDPVAAWTKTRDFPEAPAQSFPRAVGDERTQSGGLEMSGDRRSHFRAHSRGTERAGSASSRIPRALGRGASGHGAIPRVAAASRPNDRGSHRAFRQAFGSSENRVRRLREHEEARRSNWRVSCRRTAGRQLRRTRGN
jgi:ferredoxin